MQNFVLSVPLHMTTSQTNNVYVGNEYMLYPNNKNKQLTTYLYTSTSE